MKQTLKIFLVQLLLSLGLAAFFNGGIDDYDFMTAFGFLNLIIGFIGLVSGGFMNFFNTKGKETSRSIIAASGIILLVGFGTCSQFPIKHF